MATRNPTRNKWHQVAGCWSKSLGTRGKRVRLFQKRRHGEFYRAVWIPGRGRDIASLATCDRNEAEQFGERLFAELLKNDSAYVPGPVRLGELWERFQSECATFLDNAHETKRDSKIRVRVLLAFFGPQRDMRHLTAHDTAQYAAARKRGGIKVSEKRITKPVRQRSVQHDLSLLRQMLRWACAVGTPSGGRWLERNPLEGLRLDRERNPSRQVATYERFERVRKAIQNLASGATTDAERTRWLRLELAFVLVEATGRRRGSLVALRWEDVDFTRGSIRWRAEHDKTGAESVVPIPTPLLDELRRFRNELGAISGPLFPEQRDSSQHMAAEMLDQWLRIAETRAGVPKLKGALWHAYRRKWATERKDLPLRDVMAAGGWKDVTTLLTSYQQPDDATMLRVMSSPNKLVGRTVATGRD
jgi:integrase